MKNLRIIYVLLVVVLPGCMLQSCNRIIDNTVKIQGSGPVIEQERSLTGFVNVSSQIASFINIYYSQESYVNISMQENLFEHLETNVSNNTLFITFGNKNVRTDLPITIDIYTPSMERFSLAGAGNLISKLPLREVNISGSGNVTAAGAKDEVSVFITGTGLVDLFDMPVKKALIRIAGTGEVYVDVQESLDVTISGMGTVHYKGTPRIKQVISGMGSIESYD
jgi:hypothetical protein